MPLTFQNIWKEGKGVGKSGFKFRTVAYLSACLLLVTYHLENNYPIGVLEIATVIVFLIVPSVLLYRYMKNGSTLTQVIYDSKYDFFFAGWFMGVMNLCLVPSVVFAMGAITNYLAMRGFRKLYRILLIPVGCVPALAIENFKIHTETSNLILYLSLAYSVAHYLINSYILYFSGNIVRQNNIEIEKQRQEIHAQSEELRQLNEILHAANLHLEAKVHHRTEELEVKTKKLEEYTFMNAHKLRAPIATILGLIHLLDYKEEIQNEEILTGLKKTAVELDHAIKGIRARLEEENWRPESN